LVQHSQMLYCLIRWFLFFLQMCRTTDMCSVTYHNVPLLRPYIMLLANLSSVHKTPKFNAHSFNLK
jgi:hypothetical protein